jgi:hypothetical protein
MGRLLKYGQLKAKGTLQEWLWYEVIWAFNIIVDTSDGMSGKWIFVSDKDGRRKKLLTRGKKVVTA